ncbi:hypothetical protein SAMN05660909_01609 [Chitinophaga terrae (ex Kim and Jung 2007)]|uniref:DUF192 domain-containing protein n=1 Tax=Chitinophaga terrae (ex Kim and Jung 2007) TaxID=408074 RepID=A0A1H4AJ15_9BACT|nr:DUF192 domain-containing protein [Chitinophaga terrae (ex Kim and Jung 2007)]GEP89305.1 hypothetical protein CTE07_09500 [Chitinophaga terrae (ex Kim and Jung 2007)]SEA35916.1 hypothetical protein SAMN05660909_01609 [Chitinophaga terrae (ex Kim and Jung 2007)]
MQLHLKCILIAGLYAASCNNSNNNSNDSTTSSSAATTTETGVETSNGSTFRKEGTLAFIAKSGADTLRKIDIQLAQTDEQRADGLMYRKSMSDDQGMLFIFPDMEERSFWMKNTYISLDIIYIDDNFEIVSVQKYATPLSEEGLPSFKKAKYVLEVNGGFCDKYHIAYGDKITFQKG